MLGSRFSFGGSWSISHDYRRGLECLCTQIRALFFDVALSLPWQMTAVPSLLQEWAQSVYPCNAPSNHHFKHQTKIFEFLLFRQIHDSVLEGVVYFVPPECHEFTLRGTYSHHDSFALACKPPSSLQDFSPLLMGQYDSLSAPPESQVQHQLVSASSPAPHRKKIPGRDFLSSYQSESIY